MRSDIVGKSVHGSCGLQAKAAVRNTPRTNNTIVSFFIIPSFRIITARLAYDFIEHYAIALRVDYFHNEEHARLRGSDELSGLAVFR